MRATYESALPEGIPFIFVPHLCCAGRDGVAVVLRRRRRRAFRIYFHFIICWLFICFCVLNKLYLRWSRVVLTVGIYILLYILSVAPGELLDNPRLHLVLVWLLLVCTIWTSDGCPAQSNVYARQMTRAMVAMVFTFNLIKDTFMVTKSAERQDYCCFVWQPNIAWVVLAFNKL